MHTAKHRLAQQLGEPVAVILVGTHTGTMSVGCSHYLNHGEPAALKELEGGQCQRVVSNKRPIWRTAALCLETPDIDVSPDNMMRHTQE